ncbi:MAG: signal peptidase I [Candidatus Zixiibacteriota bacterium]
MIRKKLKSNVLEYVKIIALALLIAFVIRAFLISAYKIPSKSMENTLLSDDFILVNKLAYDFTDPKPGDIMVFKYPLNPEKTFIKRCIATEGQTVQIVKKVLYVDGEKVKNPKWENFTDPLVLPEEYSTRDNFGPYQVPKGQIFVLGDNRDESLDSRFWGFLEKRHIIGKPIIIYWSWQQNPDAPRFKSPYIIPIAHMFFYYLVHIPTNVRWSRIGNIVA